MELVLNQPSMEPFEPGKDLKVVVACEDYTNAQRACELLARIGLNSKAAGRLIYSWWNFEVLTITSLRALAASETAAADMIMIAAHDGPELPGGVVDWISQWLAMREFHPRALVALLDSGTARKGTAPGILSQLKKVAATGHMDFFTTQAKVGRDGEGTRRVSEAVRQFVLAHEPVRPTNCRAKRRVRAETCGR
jgi:hypothetical protein